MSIMYIEQLSKAMYTVATIGTKSHKIKNDSKKSVQKKLTGQSFIFRRFFRPKFENVFFIL